MSIITARREYLEAKAAYCAAAQAAKAEAAPLADKYGDPDKLPEEALGRWIDEEQSLFKKHGLDGKRKAVYLAERFLIEAFRYTLGITAPGQYRQKAKDMDLLFDEYDGHPAMREKLLRLALRWSA